MKDKERYNRRLPHIQPKGAIFFITFRLYGSAPKVELEKLKLEFSTSWLKIRSIKDSKRVNTLKAELRKQYFTKHDELLDQNKFGNHFLKEDKIAQIVADQLHRFDKKFYHLICYCIMSNHVHILIDTTVQIPHNIIDIDDLQDFANLDVIMKRIKGAYAIYANRLLGRKGQFWDRESFDILIKNDNSLTRVMSYILENPVKAGIVEKWVDYKWSFIAT